ncbi:MAG: enoyl-CoA hydratase, partial [Roseiflexus sp.]|nr:enoyl-CoA hydratase [Roseiflexus sp.]
VPVADLDAEVQRLVDAIVARPAEAIAIGKSLFYRQIEMSIADAYRLAGETMACNMMEPCAQEGIDAFIEKRSPAWALDKNIT